MTGVEILTTGKGATDFEPNSIAFLFVLAFCVIGGLVISSRDKEYVFGALVGLLIGMCVGLLVSIVVGIAEIEYYPTYKVTISDEVSMNEFMDKYEILNQDGKIYTGSPTGPNNWYMENLMLINPRSIEKKKLTAVEKVELTKAIGTRDNADNPANWTTESTCKKDLGFTWFSSISKCIYTAGFVKSR
jgi:hypothetical protein